MSGDSPTCPKCGLPLWPSDVAALHECPKAVGGLVTLNSGTCDTHVLFSPGPLDRLRTAVRNLTILGYEPQAILAEVSETLSENLVPEIMDS